jgi:hypothetical protein
MKYKKSKFGQRFCQKINSFLTQTNSTHLCTHLFRLLMQGLRVPTQYLLHGYESPYPIPVLHGYVRGYIMDTFPAEGHAAWLCQRFPSAGEAAPATCHSLFLGMLLASSASSLLRILTGFLRQGRERFEISRKTTGEWKQSQ